MKHTNPLLMIALISLSVLTSFMFVFYGMNTIMAKKAAESIMTFAYVTTAYGLANISILSLAWSSREAWSTSASALIALCYLGAFVMDTIKNGIGGGAPLLGVLALALVLLTNWMAVKSVIKRA